MEKGGSFSSLRTQLDGNDSFVRGGHGIIKTAGATQHTARMRRVPVWALDDEKVAQFIRIRFPKAMSDPEQRKLASRMVRFIHLYYRVGATIASVAEELKMTTNAVECLTYRVNKAMKNSFKPSHRPKKEVENGTNLCRPLLHPLQKASHRPRGRPRKGDGIGASSEAL